MDVELAGLIGDGGVRGCKWWRIVPALWGIGLFWGEHISLTSEVPELKQ